MTLFENGFFRRWNPVKTRSYWITVGLHPMTVVLIRTGQVGQGEGHVITEAELRVLQTLKPRNTKDLWHPPEAGREGSNRFPLRTPRRNQLSRHLDFGLLASRTVREPISVLWLRLRGDLLQQPWETCTSSG